MKISIITVNLNNAVSLEKTILTVIEQTFSDYELIIVDGGSIDGSVDVIRKYSNNVAKWVSQKDNGIYHAMNKGIGMATGEYCCFLNSGELLYDKFVFDKVFSNQPNESILIGNAIMVYDHVVRTEKYSDLSFGFFYNGSICHQAAFIKRGLFLQYGLYDETLKIVSDWKFFVDTIVLNNESVKYYDVDIVYHDLFGISITASELFAKERRDVLEAIVPSLVLKDYDCHWQEIKQIRRFHEFGFSSYLMRICNRLVSKLKRVLIKKELSNKTAVFNKRCAELTR